MGRTSKYDSEVKPHIEDIKKAVSAGATVEEIAKALGVSVAAMYKYKAEKKELQDAFARGREKIVFEIKAALLKKALGFNYTEEKSVAKTDKDGQNIVLVETYKRYCVPSETAANMLLMNYDKEWNTSDNATMKLRQQEQALKKAIAEANNFDLEVSD